MRVALDYNNLPLLWTVADLAEAWRCSRATMRSHLVRNPDWLKPVRQSVTRRRLYARDDVLPLLGQRLPAFQVEPTSAMSSPWDREAADEAIQQAARAKKAQQMSESHQRYLARRADWEARVKAHPPSARFDRILRRDMKVGGEVSDDGERFRVWLHFQPRFRPGDDWPGRIAIPAGGAEWVALSTDVERDAILREIDAVMTDYQPRWDAFVDARRQARKRAKEKAPEGSSEA